MTYMAEGSDMPNVSVNYMTKRTELLLSNFRAKVKHWQKRASAVQQKQPYDNFLLLINDKIVEAVDHHHRDDLRWVEIHVRLPP